MSELKKHFILSIAKFKTQTIGYCVKLSQNDPNDLSAPYSAAKRSYNTYEGQELTIAIDKAIAKVGSIEELNKNIEQAKFRPVLGIYAKWVLPSIFYSFKTSDGTMSKPTDRYPMFVESDDYVVEMAELIEDDLRRRVEDGDDTIKITDKAPKPKKPLTQGNPEEQADPTN